MIESDQVIDSNGVHSASDGQSSVEEGNSTANVFSFLKSDAAKKGFGFFIFFLAGLFEIGGGWLVWQTIRERRPWWMSLIGSMALVIYGFIATLQPISDFGRVYAIYGAFFIIFSFLWGFILDGFRPDTGDLVGAAIVIVGALVMFLWPNR